MSDVNNDETKNDDVGGGCDDIGVDVGVDIEVEVDDGFNNRTIGSCTNISPLFIPNPSSMRLISPELLCGEEPASNKNNYDDDQEEEHVGPITFHITLPSTSLPSLTSSSSSSSSSSDDDNIIPYHHQQQHHHQSRRLEFNCRDRSCGVLLPTEPSVPAIILDGRTDPFFFEPGFSLEAMTGFQIWPGSRLVVEAFTCSSSNSNNNIVVDSIAVPPLIPITTTEIPSAILPSSLLATTTSSSILLKEYQETTSLIKPTINHIRGMNILEVGAGCGAVGTCLAAAGGNVLITDLSILVEHGIWPNLRRNSNNNNSSSSNNNSDEALLSPSSSSHFSECPSFLETAIKYAPTSNDNYNNHDPVPIGKGWASAAVIDWFQPLSLQLSNETISNVDIIVACDCLFLKKLIDPLLNMISDIFDAAAARNDSNDCKLLFTYERRNMMGLFISLEDLLEKIVNERGWLVECLSWRTISVEDDGEHDLYLFQVVSLPLPSTTITSTNTNTSTSTTK